MAYPCTKFVVFALSAATALHVSVLPCRGGEATANTSLAGVEFFETAIRPLFAEHCYQCHGPETQESDLRLDTWAGMLRGGKAGPSIVPGNPQASLLLTAVHYDDPDLQMPPDGRLSTKQINDLTHWIASGAMPLNQLPDEYPTDTVEERWEQAATHWAFQPIQRPAVPYLSMQQPQPADRRLLHPIDAFLEQQRKANGLSCHELADRRTLIRRVTFDLIGLPPTEEEIHAFLADTSDHAWDRLIDRLLMSPHYGERWGRHWLDVVRYADSNGLDENLAHGNAWRYRDYVVRAFNCDKPYDEFLTEQLAGDLMPDTGDPAVRNERLVATGFLSLGPKVLAEVDETKMEMDIVDEQVDTVGRAFMGMTLGCARCHDHKFDAIDQRDYYGLAGIFKSTRTMDSFTKVARWHENTVATPEELHAHQLHQDQLASLERQIHARTEQAKQSLLERLAPGATLPTPPEPHFSDADQAALKLLRDELEQHKKATPVLPTAMGVTDGNVVDVPIHVRGSHSTLGEVVPRGFPPVLDQVSPPVIPAGKSGRLELARWLTDDAHPLTARVMVNRIWRWHFGTGLVSTPDNFGVQGQPPTHPQLLDWLAAYFIDHGYSIKSLHRLILTSRAYRMRSDFHAANAELDPANRYYWRYPARRLEAEAIRDAMLAASGRLDRRMGGNLLNVPNREFVFNHESRENVDYDFDRRSLYLPVIRNHLFPMFQLFDYSDASTLNGDRQISTVATQALYLMNAPFVNEVSEHLAQRLLAESTDDSERIRRLYVLAYARPPAPHEVERAMQFLANFGTAEKSAQAGLVAAHDGRADAWQTLCHAVLAANEFTYIH